MDCDKDNYGCVGGWMYQGFAYTSKYGLLKKDDYPAYSARQNECNGGEGTDLTTHMKSIGYVEHDMRTNEQLR